MDWAFRIAASLLVIPFLSMTSKFVIQPCNHSFLNNLLQVSHRGLFHLLHQYFMNCPCLTSIHNAGEYYSPVRFENDVELVQDAGSQPEKTLTGFADPSTDFLV
jgi:hypothetical protein